MKRRVVITGLGTINAVGNNVETTWANLVAGKCGIGLITHFDTEGYAAKIAGEVKNFDFNAYFDRKQLKKLDLFTQYALISTDEAIADAELTEDNYDPERAGVIYSAGIGGQNTFENEAINLHLNGPRRVSPFFIPKMVGNIASAHIAIKHNFKGINFITVSACASAQHGIGTAFRSIQYGDADIIIAGGTEAAVSPLAVAGFCAMKALSTRNDEPEKSSRPFDAERDGFVMSEGSGTLILEELEHAKKRGAHIYAELVGYGATCDAFHITAPAENGEGSARAMAIAIKDAGITPADVDYINAHGTSTPLNDKNETAAIRTIFGEYAYTINISSSKSMTGHTLGAAAGIEAIVCCKTIESGVIHPTINQTSPDPDCDLNYTPNTAVKKQVRYAISNSLGFGGHNGVIVLKKFES
ncbi:MAG: beta-ketoacyl-ACP synthase II [Candidatus Cloacimonetes bacterium]|nr:beta-ketoacyl-ACP synthase II [Candidatus Cloacimonadota bacterium]